MVAGSWAMTYWVYILSSKPLGPLYVGVTNDLFRRVGEHKRKDLPGFTNAMESTDSSSTAAMAR